MRLVSLSFESYKPFADKFELELRPLTLFLGRNGSGKSAVVRLIPLLFKGLTHLNTPGLELNVDDLVYGNLFSDLVHNRYPHGSIGLGAVFEDEGRVWRLEVVIQSLADPTSNRVEQVVSFFSSQLAEEAPIKLTWLRQESQKAGTTVYAVECDGLTEKRAIPFRGLLPDSSVLRVMSEDWRARLTAYLLRLTHLGPVRSMGERYYISSDKSDKILRNGFNAPQILERVRGEVLKSANNWFGQDELGQRRIEFNQSGSFFEVQLAKADVAVQLNDVGQGMNQVFPIVVQRCLPVTEARLEIVEEPESHLHPGAHGAVADLFWKAVGTSGLQMVVETHSEVFLLRIRRAIAEGKIKPEDVILYWIDDEDPDSVIRPLFVKKNGEVDDWPSAVFSEDYLEALAIRRAQKHQDEVA